MAVLDQARAAKNAVRARLLAIPGVYAVGVGPKMVAGERTPVPAVVVFVVKKKALSDVPPAERIPTEVGGVKTDVHEGALPTNLVDDPEDINDTTEYDNLSGGLPIWAGNMEGGGTLGCIGRVMPGPRIVALTNWHVTGTPMGLQTSLLMSIGLVAPGYIVTLESFEDGQPITEIRPSGSVIYISLLLLPDQQFDFYVQTARGETTTTLAERLKNEINAIGSPGFQATRSANTVTIAANPGFVIVIDTQNQILEAGPSITDLDATLRAKVVTPVITITGQVKEPFYGIYTTLNVSGGQQSSKGVFVRVNKGEFPATIAPKLAQALNSIGVSANVQNTNEVVVTSSVDQLECFVWSDIRVGQDDNGFGTECSECCSDRFGRVLAARFDLDAALVEIDAKRKYVAEVEGIGYVRGPKTVTDADVMAGITLRKRGRTTGRRSGRLRTVDTDGIITSRVDISDPNGGRFGPRRFLDAMTIQEAVGDPPFAASGDSGSAIVQDSAGALDVVGLLFGGPHGDGDSGPTIAHHIQPVLDALGMTLETATAVGQVREVPVVAGTSSTSQVIDSRTMVPGAMRDRIRQIEDEIEQTPRGKAYVEMVRRHITEARRLVNKNRHVTVAWQRNGGPLLVKAVLECLDSPESAMPTELTGKSIDACVDAIAAAFKEHGSPRFVADLNEFRPFVARLGGSTYDDLLARVGKEHRHSQMPSSITPQAAPTELSGGVTD